jgi:hypothetical protein
MLRTSAFSAIFKTASRVATYQVAQPAARLSPIAVGRFYSAGAGLERNDVESRILEILKGFDKIDPAKVNLVCLYSELTPNIPFYMTWRAHFVELAGGQDYMF